MSAGTECPRGTLVNVIASDDNDGFDAFPSKEFDAFPADDNPSGGDSQWAEF